MIKYAILMISSVCLALTQREVDVFHKEENMRGRKAHHLVAKSSSVKAVDASFHGGSSEGRTRFETFETKLDYMGRDMKKVNMTAFTGNKTDMTFS